MNEKKGIFERWSKYKLEDLVEIDPDQLSNSTNRDFEFKYIDLSSVNAGKINYPSSTIKFKNSPSRARKVIIDGDILMSTVRPNLKGFAKFNQIDKVQYIASTGFAVLREKEIADIDFIYQILFSDSIEKQIQNLVVGSNYPSINTRSVRNLEIFAPNKHEQSKIAQILTTCDKVIEQTEAVIAKYKAIKQGMLHDLFTRGLDKNGKLRPTQTEAPELYKESELGLIPKDWDVKRLNEIATMKSGEGITSPFISNHGNYPVYGGNGLRGFTSSYTHEGEFVLIGRQGALCGNTVRVTGKFYASEHAVVVNTFNFIDVDWLFQKLKGMDLNKYSEASAQPGLAVSKILQLFIDTPSHNEQMLISKSLLSIDCKLLCEEKVLEKYRSMKMGLMHNLLDQE